MRRSRRREPANGKTAARMNAASAAWAAMRVQRAARAGRPAKLMRDARRAAPGQNAHAIARAKSFVGFLHHGDVLAGVEVPGDLDALALVGGGLDVLAEDAAEDRAADRARDLAAAAANVAARDAAEHGAARGPDAGLARV